MTRRTMLASALALLGLACGDDKRTPGDTGACGLAPASAHSTVQLSADDVRLVIAQAVSEALDAGLAVTVAVIGHDGDVLGVFRMDGAAPGALVDACCGPLAGLRFPAPLAAISKAGTAAYLSSQGHAFSTRTASFIVQEHFPPGVTFTASGPLFGVQLSSLPCGDIGRRLTGTAAETARASTLRLPLGLAADPGGVPLYKDGVCVGAVAVEGDGQYSLDREPAVRDEPLEERIAVGGAQGFMAPRCIRGDQIVVNGIRFAFLDVTAAGGGSALGFDALPGQVIAVPGFFAGDVRGGPPSRFTRAELGGVAGSVSASFPLRGGTVLDAGDVERVLTQAAQQADRTRAAIRLPLGDAARVNIAVVDRDGSVLGIFRTEDAPPFGLDVAVQKARTAAFMSGEHAGDDLRRAIGGRYPDAARADGLGLDGLVALSDRAVGFLSRPFFPDDIDGSANGPFSRPSGEWSIFNVGLQLDLDVEAIASVLGGGSPAACTRIAGLPNGMQIFPGGVPLYKDGVLAGAVGVSGDGVDQDDYIAAGGAVGYDAVPAGILRSDDVFVRGVRLPYVKFPAQPNR